MTQRNTLNVILQNLRDFTVQIRHATTDQIIGTGVVVSMAGEVVTCAHVAQAALGKHPREALGAEVGVYFPQLRTGEVKVRRATVSRCFPQHDDDVVLLHLADRSTPLGPEQIAVLGGADQSEGHAFRSFGYSPMGPYPSTRADGKIMGTVDAPIGKTLLLDPIELESRQIDRGMSGAAVLDVERNLVVGLIAERWVPGATPIKDNIGWGVDACVLTFDPFNLPVRDAALPMRAAPQPRTDVEQARAAVAPNLGAMLKGAPEPLPEWVGRAELLAAITADWSESRVHICGLIGFGGEGKSSLARKWVERVSGHLPDCPTPDGVFWWNFYDSPNVDEFFEAALKYMSGGRIDPRKVPSANVRAQIIGAMLGQGRYLFIFDGLEVMQHGEGDQYGLLKSSDLREFLGFFAAKDNASFALITSRVPLTDLLNTTTYQHREVDRLSATEGRDLLKKIGVRSAQGSDAALDKVVGEWDGHALTLSLIGAYLVDKYQGDAAHIADIPAPTADEPRYDRVHRVLRRYDEHLNDAERAFLTLFSAFRTPVHEGAFEKVFRVGATRVVAPDQPTQKPGWVDRLLGRKPKANAVGAPLVVARDAQPQGGQPRGLPLHAPVAALDDAAFTAMIKRLTDYRILRHDAAAHTYTTHPLIRNHYFERLNAGNTAQARAAHERIKDYYLSTVGETPYDPTLDDLKPLIEVVYHACRAGAYDEAYRIYDERISQRDRYVLQHQLGAYEKTLSLMQEFFPNRNFSQEPQVDKASGKSWILNTVGVCLMSLGRLSEAVPFYERGNAMDATLEDWSNASIGYRNLAELHAHVGQLTASAATAEEALGLARRAENKQDECYSLARQAWAVYLRGDVVVASATFAQAETLDQEVFSSAGIRYLHSNLGIYHAEHLRRNGEADYARRVTEANIKICEEYHWAFLVSLCRRVLGDLDFDAGQLDNARDHYDAALKIARSISVRHVLIEALLARGRFNAKQGDAASAQSDLSEALDYATAGGYKIYEADIRIALAWLHRARGDTSAAQAEATRAKQMSEEMGYYWGKRDAEEIWNH